MKKHLIMLSILLLTLFICNARDTIPSKKEINKPHTKKAFWLYNLQFQ